MKRKLYVVQGDPHEWCNTQPLGPFDSETKAREAIREDLRLSFEDREMPVGEYENYCSSYHILEYVKGFAPVLDVSVKITLENVKESK